VVRRVEVPLKVHRVENFNLPMKYYFAIALISLVNFSSLSQSLGYTDLAILFSENDENGSARFVGMSGAFGAVGGEISAMNVNPAGISIYQSNAYNATFNSRNTDIISNYYNNSLTTKEQFFNLSQAGAVLVFESINNSKWNKFAIGFNYKIVKDFNDSFSAQGNSGYATFTQFPMDQQTVPIDYSIGKIQSFSSTTSGELSEASIVFSAVHENKLYIGGGFNTYELNFNQRTLLTEVNNDINGNELEVDLYQENNSVGSGFSLNAGFIYKLDRSFRFGLAYQTPSWFSEILQDTNFYPNDDYDIGETTFYQGDEVITESNDWAYIAYKLKTPSKFTASAALIFGKHGLLSIDYSRNNYQNLKLSEGFFRDENRFFQNDLRNTHNLNIGSEFRFERFSLRGGYKYKQNPLKNSSDIDNIKGYSFGGGYNFGDTKLDISYSDSNRKNSYDFFSQYSNINAANLTTENRTVTVTLSFNL